MKGRDQRKRGIARTDSCLLIKTERQETRRAEVEFLHLGLFIPGGACFVISTRYEFPELVQRSTIREGDYF